MNKKFTIIFALATIGVFAGVLVLSNVEESELAHFRAPESSSALFSEWKRMNNKTYGGAEHDRRYKIFTENHRRIQEINSIERNFTVGLNQFADLSKVEFTSLYLGLKTTRRLKLFFFSSKIEIINVGTDSVDWRTKNAVTSVKSQGLCGASWAFATTGALEGFAAIQRGFLRTFSEQQLIDCSGSYGNQGCNGGSMKNALKYTSENGIILEADYKYTGTDDTCKYDRSKVKCKNQRQDEANSDIALQKGVDQGPVAVSVEADQDVFQFYTSGVLDSVDCGIQINHGVLAVGYGVVNSMGYWIVKNSWGPKWGDQGYLKIARASGDGICGINTDNVFPAIGE